MHVSFTFFVPLDQGVLMLPFLAWVNLIPGWSMRPRIQVVLNVSIAVVEIKLLLIFVFYRFVQEVFQQVVVFILDGQHHVVIAVGSQLS